MIQLRQVSFHWLVAMAIIEVQLLPAAVADDSLRQTLNDVEVGEHWIYDDWQTAKTRAAKENKPIFALFR